VVISFTSNLKVLNSYIHFKKILIIIIFNHQIKGREISRFFYGGYSLEIFKIPTHSHSMYAKNYLTTRYIGDLNENFGNPLVVVPEKNE
jgi:hypothetical protein